MIFLQYLYMSIKNIFKSCSISDNFCFAFFCNVSLVRKPLFFRKGFTVSQNVLLITKPFLKYLERKAFWLIYLSYCI